MYADGLERKRQNLSRTVHEEATAPVWGAQHEAPLGRAKAWLERPQLKDPDGRPRALRHDGKAGVLSGLPLAVRPENESLEALNGGRRWRDESRDFLGRQERVE